MTRSASVLTASVIAIVAGVIAPAIADTGSVDDPSLPSADRIAPWIRDRLGDHASADLRLCVAGDGKVATVELVRSSTYDAFDRAVLKDVAAWQFAATGDVRCSTKTISYDARAR